MAQVYENPTDGITIGLTIDLNLQKAVEGALDEIVSKYTPEHALILAMDPQSGEILAMGSRPGFDPNNYKDYDTQTINRNLPIWMTYEPGSTFKIITLASSIEEKTIDLFKDTFKSSTDVSDSTGYCISNLGIDKTASVVYVFPLSAVYVFAFTSSCKFSSSTSCTVSSKTNTIMSFSS